MNIFKWIVNLFTHANRDFCEPKRRWRPTQKRTRRRGVQRGRIWMRCDRPLVKEYICERIEFIPESKIPLEDLYNDYVSWSVLRGEKFETKTLFCKSLNFHCKNKLIYTTEIKNPSRGRLRTYAGMAFKPEEDPFKEPIIDAHELRKVIEDDLPF